MAKVDPNERNSNLQFGLLVFVTSCALSGRAGRCRQRADGPRRFREQHLLPRHSASPIPITNGNYWNSLQPGLLVENLIDIEQRGHDDRRWAGTLRSAPTATTVPPVRRTDNQPLATTICRSPTSTPKRSAIWAARWSCVRLCGRSESGRQSGADSRSKAWIQRRSTT